MAVPMTAHQMLAISVTERVNSTISLLGTCFICGTYLFIPAFNAPLNRLIFFGSGASLGFFIFAWIAQLGGEAGQTSALCQFQAFLVQMYFSTLIQDSAITNQACSQVSCTECTLGSRHGFQCLSSFFPWLFNSFLTRDGFKVSGTLLRLRCHPSLRLSFCQN